MSLRTIKDRLSYMKSMLAAWIEEGGVAWTGAVVLLALITVPHLLRIGALEPRFRWQGMAIQLIGIFCVVIGLGKVRKDFLLPSISRGTLDYFVRSAKIFRKRPAVNIFANAGLGSVTSVGTAVVFANPGGSVEERIERLQKEVGVLRSDLNTYDGETKREFANLRTDALTERQARKLGDESGANVLTKTITGDVQLQLVGLFYLVVGVILSSIPQELAGWLPRLG